jgi:hypothetical protein
MWLATRRLRGRPTSRAQATLATDRLRRRGIPAVMADNRSLSMSSVLMLPHRVTPPSGNLNELSTIVRVRAATQDHDDDLDAAVARIAVPAAHQLPAAGRRLKNETSPTQTNTGTGNKT